eukprot:3664610-Alexandrium_andersonii.AAC.1
MPAWGARSSPSTSRSSSWWSTMTRPGPTPPPGGARGRPERGHPEGRRGVLADGLRDLPDPLGGASRRAVPGQRPGLEVAHLRQGLQEHLRRRRCPARRPARSAS